MRNCEVQIGKRYTARVDGRRTTIRVDGIYKYQTTGSTRIGWLGIDEVTGHVSQFPTATRIIAETGGPYFYNHDECRWFERQS